MMDGSDRGEASWHKSGGFCRSSLESSTVQGTTVVVHKQQCVVGCDRSLSL